MSTCVWLSHSFLEASLAYCRKTLNWCCDDAVNDFRFPLIFCVEFDLMKNTHDLCLHTILLG